ncbi:hypothetical protein CFP56_041009 [Quercus suber]|uniref:Uncharacterized protein n=1 Tax=Quercus suber TaxID=58331 RepID=A0AAW0LKE1_QUESU
MANSRLARFVTEVAPPQYISVIRQKARKMLDTINEEDRDVSAKNFLASSPKSSLWSSSSSPSASSPSASSAALNADTFPKRFIGLSDL